MKKLCNLTLFLVLMLPLVSCGQSTEAQWQEQYDLGVRYLSEGKYEEAIIAFTAAIEIDPKQAPAYVGRGDAYVASGETDENLAAARADYENAIELDGTEAELFVKLADVYTALGDIDSAIAILKQGYDATGDPLIFDRISEFSNDDKITDYRLVSTYGEIFLIGDAYKKEREETFQGYGDIITRHSTCGVRFSQPVETIVDGTQTQILEAELNSANVIHDASLLYYWSEGDHGEQMAGELVGRPLYMEGYFELNPQQIKVDGPKSEYSPGVPTERPLYDFQPTGPYVFVLTKYKIEG